MPGFTPAFPGWLPSSCGPRTAASERLAAPNYWTPHPPAPPCIDLQGGFALPGFNVSHLHLLNVWRGLGTIDLFDVRSTAEMARRCADFLRWRGVPARRAVY